MLPTIQSKRERIAKLRNVLRAVSPKGAGRRFRPVQINYSASLTQDRVWRSWVRRFAPTFKNEKHAVVVFLMRYWGAPASTVHFFDVGSADVLLAKRAAGSGWGAGTLSPIGGHVDYCIDLVPMDRYRRRAGADEIITVGRLIALTADRELREEIRILTPAVYQEIFCQPYKDLKTGYIVHVLTLVPSQIGSTREASLARELKKQLRRVRRLKIELAESSHTEHGFFLLSQLPLDQMEDGSKFALAQALRKLIALQLDLPTA